MHVSQHDGPGDRTPEGQHHEQTAAAAPQQGPLYVPVRQGPAGHVVRLWRTPVGSRTAVAFTSDQRLRSVLGPTQPWIRLSESALRAMAEPLGARQLIVDPLLTARPPAAWADPAAGRPCPRHGTDSAGAAGGSAQAAGSGQGSGDGIDGDPDGDGTRQQRAGLAP
jgi:hypothetical protein